MSPKAIGCWTKLECLRAFPRSRRKCNNNLAIFFLLVPSERTMHLCRRNAEQKDENPSKSRYFAMSTRMSRSQISLHPPHHKNTLQSTSAQPACLCKSSELIMLPPPIDST